MPPAMRTTGKVMPKNTSKCEPTNIDPIKRKMLLIATLRASAWRSLSETVSVRPRKIGALPIGLMIGNSPT
jgi:hypothetical protein